jgi:hypothetical protein
MADLPPHEDAKARRRKQASGIGTATVDASEATAQIPVGRPREDVVEKEARDFSGRSDESTRRVLQAGI